MTVFDWDPSDYYSAGHQALVNDVLCQAVEVAKTLAPMNGCRYCPLQKPCKDNEKIRTACLNSLGDKAFWVPIEKLPLLRLKGEI